MGSEKLSTSSQICPFAHFRGSRGTDPAVYEADWKLMTPVNAIDEWILYGMGNDQHSIHVHVHHM
jgi:hypothetical protein